MLDARQYGVVELRREESAQVAGGDRGDLADVVGYMIGYAAGAIYAFVTQPSVGTWADWHG